MQGGTGGEPVIAGVKQIIDGQVDVVPTGVRTDDHSIRDHPGRGALQGDGTDDPADGLQGCLLAPATPPRQFYLAGGELDDSDLGFTPTVAGVSPDPQHQSFGGLGDPGRPHVIRLGAGQVEDGDQTVLGLADFLDGGSELVAAVA